MHKSSDAPSRRWLVLALLILIVGFLIYDRSIRRDVVYCIDLRRAWESFDMKNELEQERNTKLNSQQSVVSDLAFKLERNTSNGTRKDSLYAEWMKADYTLKEMNQQLTAQYDLQIQERLTVYLKEFAEERGLGQLIAYEDSYPVIFTQDKYDLTEEAISFINNKYNGK